MKVIFHHPLKTTNPLIDFDPSISDHYPPDGEVGVYIHGIRAKVDGILKFIPIVVGEGKLYNALYERHYMGKYLTAFENLTNCKQKSISEPKEIWDFSKTKYSSKDLSNIYSDMGNYDGLPRTGRKEPPFLRKIASLNTLLYFQNIDFFNYKHGVTEKTRNLRSDEAVRLLAAKATNALNAKQKYSLESNYINLILTLKNFTENFYFVYSMNPSLNTVANRHAAEVATKSALKKLGINTTADSNRKGNITLINQIDLSNIQNDLVNLGNHAYNNHENYQRPLIINTIE